MRLTKKQLRNEADRRVSQMIAYAADLWFPEKDLQALDRRNLDHYIAELRKGEASVRRLRKRLEALHSGVEKSCPFCGRPVAGRADAVFCSSSCRLRAHRSGGNG